MDNISVEAPPLNSPDLFPANPNEQQSAETTTQAQGSLLETLRAKTKGVFESAGVMFKKGPGRPPKNGKPGKLDIALNAPSTALPLGAADSPPVVSGNLDPALVKKCCNAVIKAFKGFGDKMIHRRAVRVGYSPKEAQQLVTDTTVTSEESDSFSELATICLQKYGVGSEYLPEVGLIAVIAGVGVRYVTVMNTLTENEKEQQAQPGVTN